MQHCYFHAKEACLWLREISPSYCFTDLPGHAWLLLNKIYNLQFLALHKNCYFLDPLFQVRLTLMRWIGSEGTGDV